MINGPFLSHPRTKQSVGSRTGKASAFAQQKAFQLCTSRMLIKGAAPTFEVFSFPIFPTTSTVYFCLRSRSPHSSVYPWTQTWKQRGSAAWNELRVVYLFNDLDVNQLKMQFLIWI